MTRFSQIKTKRINGQRGGGYKIDSLKNNICRLEKCFKMKSDKGYIV